MNLVHYTIFKNKLQYNFDYLEIFSPNKQNTQIETSKNNIIK